MKFLPLGRWRGTLEQEDLPVKYIALSEHLDMVGVQLKATSTQTRKSNCDTVQDKVSKVIGPWRGGKFMCLTLRPFSLNTCCLSKVWFKCGSVDLRAGDISKITSTIKSWLFADQLEQPEEMVLHRNRCSGGLGLYNIKGKAMAEFIRSFLETAIHPRFTTNQYHNALYRWNVLSDRSIRAPSMCPYMSEEIFTNIKQVKDEGLLNIATLSSGQWYRVLIENNITMVTNDDGRRSLKLCRTETNHPEVNWEATWRLSSLKGLSSEDHSFLWKMLHNLLPTQERINRMGLPNAPTPMCTHCDMQAPDQVHHALVTCPQNKDVSDWLLHQIHPYLPNISPQQLVLLHLGVLQEDQELPLVWLITQVLRNNWTQRLLKKKPQLFQTRAVLEAGIAIMRKTRFSDSCTMIETILVS